jgi:hypothetical protein
MRGNLSCTLIAALAAAVLCTPALALDIDPPEWRGADRTTMQAWEFGTAGTQAGGTWYAFPDVYVTPLQQSLAAIVPGPGMEWQEELNGRRGVWPLSGEINLPIWNFEDPLIMKRVWIQMTWQPQRAGMVPEIVVEAPATFQVREARIVGEQDLGDGWTHTAYEALIWPNPPQETVRIFGEINVDELVIDTICPEPASLSVLAIGGLLVLARRRRSR